MASKKKKSPWTPTGSNTVPYEAAYEYISTADLDDFGSYYLRHRKALETTLIDIIETSRLPIISRRIQDVVTALNLTRSANDITGQVGEILSSYVLERRYDVLLFGISWPAKPFDVHRGNDISGVCKESWLVVYAESKATAAKSISSQAREACKGLHAAKLWPRFSLDIEDGQSRQSAIAAVRKAIRQGQIANTQITPATVSQLVSSDRFVRVAAILHDKTTSQFDYTKLLSQLKHDDVENKAMPGSQDPRLPTVFIDMRVDHFEDARSAIAYLELYESEA